MGQTQGGKGGGASTAGMDWQSVCIQLERQSGASASGGLTAPRAHHEHRERTTYTAHLLRRVSLKHPASFVQKKSPQVQE